MDVCVMFSGGKDSTFAIAHAMKQGWNVKYLLSVKPTRTDCYLFHFATVEHTPKQAEAMGLKHILVGCDVAEPKQEAQIVRKVVEENPVDAIILGGVGLQETQIKSIKEAVADLGIKVFASHAGMNHEDIVKEAIAEGFDIRVTQVAVDGLNEKHLGMKLDEDGYAELCRLANKFGFHNGGEGGHFDTFVCDGPIFNKAVNFASEKKVWKGDSGYLEVEAELVEKAIA